MMTQQIVIAIMNTWNGKRLNWAHIVYMKIMKEVQRYHEGEPKTWEVYFAFYISIYCQKLLSRGLQLSHLLAQFQPLVHCLVVRK